MFFIQPTLIGFVAKDQPTTYTETLNLEFTEPTEYEWTVENQGQHNSLKVSGIIRGSGEVKIYINDLLILTSQDLPYTEEVEESFSEIDDETLTQTEDSSPSQEGSPLSETTKTAETTQELSIIQIKEFTNIS